MFTCLCFVEHCAKAILQDQGPDHQEQAYKDKDRLEQCAKEHPGDISKVKGMAREMLNRNSAGEHLATYTSYINNIYI